MRYWRSRGVGSSGGGGAEVDRAVEVVEIPGAEFDTPSVEAVDAPAV